jgi:hypothetical protein
MGALILPELIHLFIVAKLIRTCFAASEVVNFPLIMSSLSHISWMSREKSKLARGPRQWTCKRNLKNIPGIKQLTSARIFK